MSHTINSNQPHNRSSHPPTRGVNSAMPPPSHPASQSRPSSRTASGTHLAAFVPPHLQQSSVPGNNVPIPYQNGPGGGGYLYQAAGNSAHFNQFNVGQDESNFDSSHHASNNGFEPLGNSYISTPPLPPPFVPGQDDRDRDESTYSNQAGRNLMISESSSFSSQINHDVLQEIFDLSEHDLSHARRLLEMTQPNIMGALVYGLISIRTNQARPASLAPDSGNPPPNQDGVVDDFARFEYKDQIKNNIRDFARRKILEARLVTYSRPVDDDGASLPTALINMTQAYVSSLPRADHAKYLPPGYSAGNGAARRSLWKLLGELLKHIRVSCRNLLLKNIIDTSNGKANGNAPSLDMLYNQIHSALSVTGAVPGNWSQLSPRVKVRFAYMRLETAAHSMKPTQGHGSQWTPIDNHLLFMSQQSPGYLQAWAAMIMEKDNEVFGPRGAVWQSVKHLCTLPTHEDVLEREVLDLSLPARTQQSQAQEPLDFSSMND
ncbi:hypothetical protein PCANC_09216 [Puccinia coronata f. sp. avenae]|uniref:Uncharacterized protein n=1 Tax=Puccinia coronata f. sp. avenae TaxID=200324 RepID=A0A2N5SZD7_9BASI|nr:hypothetical protein PCANC_09216 [Puccinia coronata f. sp. avenae]